MSFFYDSVIFSFLIADGILLAVLLILRKWKKLFTIALIAWLIIFYGSFIEPRLLIVEEKTINLSQNSGQTLRAVLISDFHLGPYKKKAFVERVVRKISALSPDLILIAGDSLFDDREQIEFLTPLSGLGAPLGIFAVLGNHDYGEIQYLRGETMEKRARAVREKLESLGITVLISQGKKITTGDRELFLLGTDEVWTDRADISRALRHISFSQVLHPSILLTHNPDIVMEAEKLGIDLVLAGHTHGGQIRLPFLGSVPPIPDKLGRNYDRGLFQFGKTQLFITSGLGESGPRARLFVPPEIVVLNINI